MVGIYRTDGLPVNLPVINFLPEQNGEKDLVCKHSTGYYERPLSSWEQYKDQGFEGHKTFLSLFEDNNYPFSINKYEFQVVWCQKWMKKCLFCLKLPQKNLPVKIVFTGTSGKNIFTGKSGLPEQRFTTLIRTKI